ncbi:hypothetical protein BH11MYX4_BH11MYX4_10140 [soil metagenome]
MSITPRLRVITALLAGLVFGVGLAVSGMLRPAKVLGFLDVAGAWDPSLAFVMMGAIGVHATAVVVARRRLRRPFASDRFHWAEPTAIDTRLLAGAAVFGVGWGLGGFCPGPALASAASGNLVGVAFVVAMILGIYARHATARSGLASGRS